MYNEYSYGIYTDVEILKTQLKRIYKKNPIPGQPSIKRESPIIIMSMTTRMSMWTI